MIDALVHPPPELPPLREAGRILQRGRKGRLVWMSVWQVDGVSGLGGMGGRMSEKEFVAEGLEVLP